LSLLLYSFLCTFSFTRKESGEVLTRAESGGDTNGIPAPERVPSADGEILRSDFFFVPSRTVSAISVYSPGTSVLLFCSLCALFSRFLVQFDYFVFVFHAHCPNQTTERSQIHRLAKMTSSKLAFSSGDGLALAPRCECI
jgi:hypothetical protein